MSGTPQSKRILWLDLVKGLAMLAIVYGHITSDLSGAYHDKIYCWIYAWHVPVFAVITGVIYGARLQSLCINKIPYRAQSILIPYMTFAVLYIVGNLLFASASVEWAQDALYDIVVFKGRAALWFLPALLFAQIIVSISYSAITHILGKTFCARRAWIKQWKAQIQLIFLGCVLVPLYVIAVRKELALTDYILFERSVVLAFWMYVGICCHAFFSHLSFNVLLALLFGITSFSLSNANGPRELWGANIGDPWMYTAAVFTGTCCVISVAQLIDFLLHPQNVVCRFISFVGAESLIVMGIHQLGLAIVSAHFNIASISRPIYALIQVGAVIVVVGVTYVISRRWPIFFGKRRACA